MRSESESSTKRTLTLHQHAQRIMIYNTGTLHAHYAVGGEELELSPCIIQCYMTYTVTAQWNSLQVGGYVLIHLSQLQRKDHIVISWVRARCVYIDVCCLTLWRVYNMIGMLGVDRALWCLQYNI